MHKIKVCHIEQIGEVGLRFFHFQSEKAKNYNKLAKNGKNRSLAKICEGFKRTKKDI